MCCPLADVIHCQARVEKSRTKLATDIMGIRLVVIVVGITVSGQKSKKLSQSQTPLGRDTSFPCPPFLLIPLTAECQMGMG